MFWSVFPQFRRHCPLLPPQQISILRYKTNSLCVSSVSFKCLYCSLLSGCPFSKSRIVQLFFLSPVIFSRVNLFVYMQMKSGNCVAVVCATLPILWLAKQKRRVWGVGGTFSARAGFLFFLIMFYVFFCFSSVSSIHFIWLFAKTVWQMCALNIWRTLVCKSITVWQFVPETHGTGTWSSSCCFLSRKVRKAYSIKHKTIN